VSGRPRSEAGETAPAHGLYLEAVRFRQFERVAGGQPRGVIAEERELDEDEPPD
jgi:hypothetical protein